ncbi:hypothetical protein VTL71DRAFT_10531 [Oculimacula yallundae]|uniref:C2H2-type domain-containing protein n=1 Tax=Oculimacula yallundae TaxID=86028 RepID=A0ABR4CTS9_9HELO
MERPPRNSRLMGDLPQIQVHNPSSTRPRPSRAGSYNSESPTAPSSIPMSIPNVREFVPPPLPPPRHLADIADGGHNGPDIAWKWGNRHKDGNWGEFAPSIPQGSSLHGTSGSFLSRRGPPDEKMDFQSRGSSISSMNSDVRHGPHQKDEGYESLGASVWSNKSKPQESLPSLASFQSSVHDQFQVNAQAFDKSQLQKLDFRRGSDTALSPRGYSKPALSSFFNNDASPISRLHEHRHPSQLKPLSLPILPGRPGLGESPLGRWTDTPLSSAISPGTQYPRFGSQNHYDDRSPIEATDANKFVPPHIRRSGSTSANGFYDDTSSGNSGSREYNDQRGTPEQDNDFHMEDAGMRRLHIDDYPNRPDMHSPCASVGQKRRASSPPVEEGPTLHSMGSAGDLRRRREAASRASPTPRLHSNSGSVSSTASGPRNNSYASTLSVNASSITSMGSYGRLSPGGLSPGGISNAGSDMSDSPYVSSLSLNPSPGVSRTCHSRVLSDSRPLMSSRKLSESLGTSKHSTSPKLHGVYMCECCPKKPKKFDSQEQLNAHEQEKQYECNYCNNRFKNKNEAERHQNSLHLRRHSWSCAVLSGPAAAFHNSQSRPNEADTCGYCGEDFPRSGKASPSMLSQNLGSELHPTTSFAIATDQDWEARVAHLQEMHKFGECNQAKKFFRADHFRQHLKHSHAGTSGKWTNMLENACMQDEPLPEPRRGPGHPAGVMPGVARFGSTVEHEQPVRGRPAGAISGGARVGRISEEDETFDVNRREGLQAFSSGPVRFAAGDERTDSEMQQEHKK